MDTLIRFPRHLRLLLVAVPLGAIVLFIIAQETASASVPLPWRYFDLAQGQSNPRGMWGDGDVLWVVENDQGNNEQRIFTYNLSSGERRIQGEFSLNDGIDIQGIWSDGTVMWVADWSDKKLYAYEHNKNGYNNNQRIPDKDISLAGSNDHPRGVWGTGTTVLVVDSDDTKVYVYSTTDGSRLTSEEFDLHSDHDKPYGIWGEGTRVWINDTDDNMVYVYQRSPNTSNHGIRVESQEIRLPRGNDDSWGIWSDGEILWIADDEDDKVFATHFRGFRHILDEIDISDVTTPGALWTNGETMWVSDTGRSDHGMLLAYTLSDRSRDSSKDVQLGAFNKKPLSIWSDGDTVWTIEDTNGTDTLLPYDMEPNTGQEGQTILTKLLPLDSDNSDPRGIWSDGDTIWVSDSGDDKLYAYDLSQKSRQSGKEINLVNNNDHPAEIWSDGETIWVLDTDDKYVFAYELSSGNRKRGREFGPVPDNDDPDGGLTGHRLRFWVLDGDDQKLYAYGGRNTPPTFNGATASFEFHRSLAAGGYIGTVPQATDPDDDEVSYLLTSGTFGVFRLDSTTGELFVKDGAPEFTGRESYTLTVSVTDGRNRLDALDGGVDDAIDVSVNVLINDEPEITTPTGTVFSVAENATSGDTVGQLDITDLDGDSLTYEYRITPSNPFWISEGEIKLSSGHNLDYENTKTYEGTIRVRDGKDVSGQTDLAWDDEIDFTINVTNVDEPEEIILSSSHPQVDTQLTATLRDPDGVDLSDGNQITWVVRKNVNGSFSNWNDISSTDTSSTDFSYTPADLDAGTTLQFEATYKDVSDGTQDKTAFVNTANTVLMADPTNKPPVWTETGTVSRSVAESVAAGSNIGDPVTATDPENDTLIYVLIEYFHVGNFEIDSGTGQISLKDDKTLDYESVNLYWVRVVVMDGKDSFGNDDPAAFTTANYDSSKLVKINVTNVQEDGSVHLSTDSPMVDEEISAWLGDPDGSVSNLAWQWQIADTNPSGTWNDISDATSASYTPALADLRKYLRAKVTYNDWENSTKEAIGTAANAVSRPVNGPPEFNEGATATRSVDENAAVGTRLSAAITALDPESDALTYSLATGPDSDNFAVDSENGQLEVASGATLDFENDPSLEVVVQVSDGKAADHSTDAAVDDTITVAITLVNVDDPGEVTLSMSEPVTGESITATLTDDDGSVSGESWLWEKSQDGDTGWLAIPGASSETYTPVEDDEGMYLRATVSYTDGEGAGKSAKRVSTHAVRTETDDREEQSDPEDNGEQDPENNTGSNEGSNGNGEGSDSQESRAETFTDICRRDFLAGSIAQCVVSNLATARVEHDGSYTVDWSEWDEDHPEVTGYTIVLRELIHKSVYDNGVRIDTSTLSDVYETCEFADGKWNCERPIKGNYFEDWDGSPTGERKMVDNSDQTQWTYSLDSPGRRTAVRTFQRWSGDASDPDNEPVPETYTAVKFEMDLVHIMALGGSVQHETVGIDGANGFD